MVVDPALTGGNAWRLARKWIALTAGTGTLDPSGISRWLTLPLIRRKIFIQHFDTGPVWREWEGACVMQTLPWALWDAIEQNRSARRALLWIGSLVSCHLQPGIKGPHGLCPDTPSPTWSELHGSHFQPSKRKFYCSALVSKYIHRSLTKNLHSCWMVLRKTPQHIWKDQSLCKMRKIE